MEQEAGLSGMRILVVEGEVTAHRVTRVRAAGLGRSRHSPVNDPALAGSQGQDHSLKKT
jgi:hypothetical protein